VQSIQEIEHRAIPILKAFNVVSASIFGSFVRGNHCDTSDVDILYTLPDDEYKNYFRLCSALEHALGRKVDLVAYDLVPEEAKHCIQEHVLI